MNIASMTGFGRAQGPLSSRLSASVVVRSVNHKFLDVVVKSNVRDEMPELDAAVRATIAESMQRGRVTVQVEFQRTAEQPLRVVVNTEAVVSAATQLAEPSLPEAVTRTLDLGDVLSIPGLVSVESMASRLEEGEVDALARLTAEATAELVAMRRAEAAGLVSQILADLGVIDVFLDWFEPRTHEFRALILERLRERLAELVGPTSAIDPERQVQEAAVIADRSDVAEETVRLRSHLAGFRDRLTEGGAVGRTLDFMCQEILRELNTLGSKCREIGVAERLVEAKASLERVREQIQNLE